MIFFFQLLFFPLQFSQLLLQNSTRRAPSLNLSFLKYHLLNFFVFGVHYFFKQHVPLACYNKTISLDLFWFFSCLNFLLLFRFSPSQATVLRRSSNPLRNLKVVTSPLVILLPVWATLWLFTLFPLYQVHFCCPLLNPLQQSTCFFKWGIFWKYLCCMQLKPVLTFTCE